MPTTRSSRPPPSSSRRIGSFGLGILITLIATVFAVMRRAPGENIVGYSVILAGGALYVPVAIWHFIEHANFNDRELAHYLLAIGQVLIFAGAIAATIAGRRGRALAA